MVAEGAGAVRAPPVPWSIVGGALVLVAVLVGALFAVGALHVGTPATTTVPGASPGTSVEFTESGLPAADRWFVQLGNLTRSGPNTSLLFAVPPGTYPFTVIAPDGVRAFPSDGSLSVGSTEVIEAIAFASSSRSGYPVNFTELGLPLGDPWNVTVDGSSTPSEGMSDTVALDNGSWSYTLSTPESGFFADPRTGTVNVSGAAVNISVEFESYGTGSMSNLTLGGSAMAFPFDATAAQQFEQNESGLSVSDNEGGTAAGMLAVCQGAVDIGVASAPEPVSALEAQDGCRSTAVVTTMAYGEADVVVSPGDPDALHSISWDTLATIYDHASSTPPTLVAGTIDGESTSVAPWNGLPTGPLTWSEIPACVRGASPCGPTFGPDATETGMADLGPGAACVGAAKLICANGTPLASPCGFTVCAGGSGPNATIVTVGYNIADVLNEVF